MKNLGKINEEMSKENWNYTLREKESRYNPKTGAVVLR